MLLELSDQDIQIKTVIYSINNCNFTSHYNFNNQYFTESNPAVAELPQSAPKLPYQKKKNSIKSVTIRNATRKRPDLTTRQWCD